MNEERPTYRIGCVPLLLIFAVAFAVGFAYVSYTETGAVVWDYLRAWWNRPLLMMKVNDLFLFIAVVYICFGRRGK